MSKQLLINQWPSLNVMLWLCCTEFMEKKSVLLTLKTTLFVELRPWRNSWACIIPLHIYTARLNQNGRESWILVPRVKQLQLDCGGSARGEPVDEKLPELEPRVSQNFDIKIGSRKTLLKVLASPQTDFQSIFSVSRSCSLYEISQYFFRWFKALLLVYPNG